MSRVIQLKSPVTSQEMRELIAHFEAKIAETTKATISTKPRSGKLVQNFTSDSPLIPKNTQAGALIQFAPRAIPMPTDQNYTQNNCIPQKVKEVVGNAISQVFLSEVSVKGGSNQVGIDISTAGVRGAPKVNQRFHKKLEVEGTDPSGVNKVGIY